MIISFCETLKNLSRNFKDSSKSWTNHIQMMLILALIRGSNSAFLASITWHWFNEVKNQGEPFLLNMHSAVKHLPIFWNNVNEFFFMLQGVLAHRVFVKLLSCICKWIGLRLSNELLFIIIGQGAAKMWPVTKLEVWKISDILDSSKIIFLA